MSDAIDRMLAYHQAARHYPGAQVLIESGGQALCRRSAGRLHGHDDSSTDAMPANARFRIASLSKPMVSAVALMLIESGRLRLATPIGEILPELTALQMPHGRPPGTKPTVAHLLTHTAGFLYAPEIRDADMRRHALAAGLGEMPGLTRQAFLGALAALPLQAEPGTRFQYGYSTDVLGLLIERVAGARLGAVMQDMLFDPLGMAATGFRAQQQEHAAMPTAFAEDLAWHRFCGQFEAVERELTGAVESAEVGPLESGGGGIISTLDDLARFARMLGNRGRVEARALLSEATIGQMMQDHLGPAIDGPAGFVGGGWGFGLGGAVRLPVGAAAVPAAAGEFTWSGVTGQSLFIDPARGWFALMLSANTASRVNVRFEFRRAAAH